MPLALPDEQRIERSSTVGADHGVRPGSAGSVPAVLRLLLPDLQHGCRRYSMLSEVLRVPIVPLPLGDEHLGSRLPYTYVY